VNWAPLLLSIQVTAIATVLILVIGVGAALVLARCTFPGQRIVETLINLPLVLPPSVLGFYLLLGLGRGSPLVDWFGWQVVFTPAAAVIASTVVGLPLMIQSARAAIAGVDPSLERAARTLGDSEPRVLWRITLPLARRGILAGLVLGSARALGEFGATLMVAGNLPGRTQTMPLAIYDAVQARRYEDANGLVAVLTVLAFACLWWVRQLEPARPAEQSEARREMDRPAAYRSEAG